MMTSRGPGKVESIGDTRSAGLRAADWRFLLPKSPHQKFGRLVLLGGPQGLAQLLLEFGLAEQVLDDLPPDKSADAVIVLYDAKAMLPEVAECLVAGGVLYFEIDRRSRGYLASAPSRVRRSLHAAGLSRVVFYSVVPGFANHQMYLPLDVPGALKWYVKTLYHSFTPRQYLLRTCLSAVTRLDGRRFTPFAPRLAVTAVAGDVQPGAPSVLQLSKLPLELRGNDLTPLVLTSGGDRVVVLPFSSEGSQPAAVLKVPRLPGFNGRTENEQATLQALWTGTDPEIHSAIPQSLGTVRYREVTVGIESYAGGQPLSRSSGRWGASESERVSDLRVAAAWLAEFHERTQRGRPPWSASEFAQWVEGPLTAYCEAFGVTAEEERLFAEIRQYATSLTGIPFPIVIQHRDYTIWNIFRDGRELRVLDWEGSRPGPALCDLLHFVTHWYEAVNHAHSEAAKQRCFELLFGFTPGDAYSGAVSEVIASYMHRLTMDRRFLPLLLVYTWVELGLRRLDQQRVQGGIGYDVREGNRYLPFLTILAQSAERLFRPVVHSGAPTNAPVYSDQIQELDSFR